MTELQDLASLRMRTATEALVLGGLPASLARIYGQHVRLSAGRQMLPSWTAQEFDDRFVDVMQLLDAADEDRAAGRAWRPAYRRAGEVLEWLAHPALNTARLPLKLLGAGCYQLAGYPARAGTLVAGSDDENTAPLLALLLKADFPSLLEEASESSYAAPSPDPERPIDPSDWYGLIAGNVAAALGVLAADFRWGADPRRSRALHKLDIASKVLRSSGDPFAWLLVKLTADVAREMVDTSLRPYLTHLSADLPEAGRAALESYSRQRFLDRRILAWPSQVRGLDQLALGRSFALCTPTGSGKTTVAEVALLRGLFRPRDSNDLAPLCLYIVPTRALAAEVESKLGRALRAAGRGRPIVITGLYGGTDWGPSDAWLSADEPTVLICTQEKAEALLRFFGIAIPARLEMVIVDEAHEIAEPTTTSDLATGESRGLRLETLISRLKAQVGDSCQFIAMSAVAENLDRALARWMLSSEAAEPVISDYRSTRQALGRLMCSQRQTRIVHDVLDGARLRVVDRRNSEAFVPQPFPPHPPAPDFQSPEKGLAPYALWAATHLAAAEEPGQAVLVSIASGIRNWANWFGVLLDQWGDAVPNFFQAPPDDEDGQLWNASLDAMEDYFGAASRERQLLLQGVIVHYGRMPGRLPRLLVELVERRIVNVVLATSGLSQGVNLPFETVLVPKLRRHDAPMGRREFWNLVGRAGRPGVSTEGRTLVLDRRDTEPWQQRRFQQDYLRLISRSPGSEGSEVASPLATLLLLIRDRLGVDSDEAYFEWLESTAPLDLDEVPGDAAEALDALDGLLIATLAEQPAFSALDLEEWLKKAWRATFASAAAAEERELEETFVRRGIAVATRHYQSDDQRRAIYLTSLPPRDARRATQLADEFRSYVAGSAPYASMSREDQLAFVLGVVGLLGQHPRFTPPPNVGRSKRTWQDVLSWWLAKDLAPNEPSQSQVSAWYDFISNHFSYRFNWALSGVLAAVQSRENAAEAPMPGPEWPTTELPWVAVWLKDMIEWGTLDPVTAYVLARGGARTRPEAATIAGEYYEDWGDDPGDPLDPESVRAWVIARRTATVRRGLTFPPATIPAEPSRDLPETGRDFRLRVVPSVLRLAVRWLDPSGRQLALSIVDSWDPRWRRDFDFWLHPTDAVVKCQQY